MEPGKLSKNVNELLIGINSRISSFLKINNIYKNGVKDKCLHGNIIQIFQSYRCRFLLNTNEVKQIKITT